MAVKEIRYVNEPNSSGVYKRVIIGAHNTATDCAINDPIVRVEIDEKKLFLKKELIIMF